MTYRTFSSTSGVWGPVKRSSNLSDDNAEVHVLNGHKHAVVCSGSVFCWLVILLAADTGARTCLFVMDTRTTERTWTTELPKHWNPSMLVLATSEDGRPAAFLYCVAVAERPRPHRGVGPRRRQPVDPAAEDGLAQLDIPELAMPGTGIHLA